MATHSRLVTPSNSVILVMDPQLGKIPNSMNGRVVAATDSCVAVGTKEEYEGPTRIRITDEVSDDTPPLKVHDGAVEVTSGEIVVANILGEAFLRWPVEGTSVGLQIYINHSTEPDEIVVVVGGVT